MEIARDGFLFLHLVGFAALFGGAFVQLRDEIKVVNAAMLQGALIQVVSGIFLVGLIEAADEDVNSAKIAVKFGVALVVALLCWINRRKTGVPHGLFYGVFALTVANTAVAVFW